MNHRRSGWRSDESGHWRFVIDLTNREPSQPLLKIPHRGRVYQLPRPGDIPVNDFKEAASLAEAARMALGDEAEELEVTRKAQPFIARLMRRYSPDDADAFELLPVADARDIVESALEAFTLMFLGSIKQATVEGIADGEKLRRMHAAGPPSD
jgi:hypothetical protein